MSMTHRSRRSLTFSLGAGLLAAAVLLSGAQAAQAQDSPSETGDVIDQGLRAVGQSPNSVPDPNVDVAGDEGTLITPNAHITLTPSDAEDSEFRERESGLQALTVLREGESNARFAIDISRDVTYKATGDGGFDIFLLGDGGGAVSVAHISAPWAIDADGRRLPSSYAIANGSIVQSVDTRGASFPVVADPLITLGLANAPYGPGLYINLTGGQIRVLGAAIIAAGGVGAIAACTLAKVPQAAASLVRFICTAGGIPSIPALFSFIAESAKRSGLGWSTCYQTRLGSGGAFVGTASSNCA